MAQLAQLVGCPNCGAELWVPPGYAGFRCQYCAVHVGLRGAEPRRAKQQPISVGKQPAIRPGNCTVPPLVQVSRKKRAVLCGISYKNTPYELKGTINDINCMKYLLTTRFKFPEESVIVLTEKEKDYRRIPTKRNMQIWMRWLVQDCQPGDSLVFHYAGHGSQQEDYTGHEVDGYDETLLPLDFETEGMIVDNEINDTLVKPLPLGVRLHAIIDASHSGTVLDLPYVCLFNPSEGKCVWEDHTPQNGMRKGTRGGEAISFSCCDDDQTSAEVEALSKITSTGAMTSSFIKAIEKGDGKTYGSLFTSMRDGIREARQKPNKPSTLTSMIFEGDNYKQGKIQVHGTLKSKNAFMPPFHKICTNCNKKIPDNLADCIICKQNTPFRPEHCLECALETEDGVFNCTMKFPELKQCCPTVALTTHEQYRNNISSTVFHLRRLFMQGVFVLDAYNTITEITITQ